MGLLYLLYILALKHSSATHNSPLMAMAHLIFYSFIIRYIDHMNFAAYMVFSFIIFLHVILVFFNHSIYNYVGRVAQSV